MKLNIRQCAQCKKPTLLPKARRFSGFKTIIEYECSNCGTALVITPAASIGVTFAVGALALLIWGALLLHDRNGLTLVGQMLYALALIALAWITIPPAIALKKNPSRSTDQDSAVETEIGERNIFQRSLIWLEGAGFLGGLFAPLAVFGAVLAIATLIGFINFTYFGN